VLAFEAGAASRHISSHIARYSPARAAAGVIEAADRLCRSPLV